MSAIHPHRNAVMWHIEVYYTSQFWICVLKREPFPNGSAATLPQRKPASITFQRGYSNIIYNLSHLKEGILRFKESVSSHQGNSTFHLFSMLPWFTFILKHTYSSLRNALTLMIKRCWPELCWYIKQHEQRKAHNSREEAHIGSTVPLLSLIFTVLHFVFSPFHNAVIWERNTHRVGALVHTQMIKSNSSQWSFFLCLCCRQTYMSNSTQIIKVRTHEMSEGSVGGVALWFRTFLSAATEPFLSTDLPSC